MGERFAGDRKEGRWLLASAEDRLKAWLVPKVPPWLETYHLTLTTVLWCALVIAAGWLGRADVLIVALLARYHRRTGPRTRHPAYRALSGKNRIRVAKLAAILRVADALERAHSQRVRDFSVEITRNKIRLNLVGVSDAAVERLAMQSKGDLFHDVFGL